MTKAQKDLLDRVVSGEVTLQKALARGLDVALVLHTAEGWHADDHDVVVPTWAETVKWFNRGR